MRKALVAVLSLLAGLVPLVGLGGGSPAGATALQPFIDLQEQGLTVVSDGAGLQALGTGSVNLTVGPAGAVRFALLYWAGRDDTTHTDGTCPTVAQPREDQQVLFQNVPVTGTIIGTECQPATTDPSGAAAEHIAFFADVTSLVSAEGVGSHTFTFADGDTASNLSALQGVTLVVAYTDPAEADTFRVLVWDGADLAQGTSAVDGGNRTAAAVTFNHGINADARTGQLLVVAGGGTAAGQESLAVSSNPTQTNTLDASDGAAWDTDTSSVVVPAGLGTTTVQLTSPTTGSPDPLLLTMAALRVPAEESQPPTCSITATAGPPVQHQFRIVDHGTGLAEIVVTKSENADTVVPPFTVGTTDPVIATSTRIDQTKPEAVEIRLTDLAGNVHLCSIPAAAPSISGTPPDASRTVPYEYQFETGGDPVVSLAGGTLPPGLLLDVDGLLHGTPTTGGDFSFTVKASNPTGPDDTHATTLHVATDDAVAPACPVTRTAGPPVQHQFAVEDEGSGLASILVTTSENADTVVPPFTVGTTDPVTVTSTRIDQTAAETIEMQVTDVAGNTTTCGYAVAPPSVRGTPPTGGVGEPYGYTFPVSGSPFVTAPRVSGTLPPGLSYNAISRRLSGTPTKPGTYTFSLRAQNTEYPPSTPKQFTVVVRPKPMLTVTDRNVVEGDGGFRNLSFTVRLSRASTVPVTVRYATADGSAVAPSDYVAKAGTLTFSPGQASKTITVQVRGDTQKEPNQTMFVLLRSPTAAFFGDPSGTGGIFNDD